MYTIDETAWFADLLLPEDGELESLQLITAAGVGIFENRWDRAGFLIKQPVVQRAGNTMNITDIATELAAKLGMLSLYNEEINKGAYLGIRLKDTPDELKLDKKYTAEELYDRFCKAATRGLSSGKLEHGLDWFKENGGFFGERYPRVGRGIKMERGGQAAGYGRPWYLYPAIKEMGIRFELPYQERLKRIGEELKERLHEKGIRWWDRQAETHQALPKWEDTSKFLDEVTIKLGKNPKDYPFWILAARSMLYAWGSNVGVPILHEAANHSLVDNWIQMNKKVAESLNMRDEDEVWIESPYGKIKGKVKLSEGIRPDCLLTTGMHGHWVTPFAKDLGIPNLNWLVPALTELTDESAAAKEHVRVKIYKAGVEK